MRRAIYGLLAISILGQSTMAEPLTAELESVAKISDRAPHSAFTDLVFHKGQFVCAFREGRAHVSSDGTIRVLTSKDGNDWQSAASIGLEDVLANVRLDGQANLEWSRT